VSARCSELSLAAGEDLRATAVTAQCWLLVEVPGPWPRDVGDETALPAGAREAVAAWLERTPGGRLQFVRRPGGGAGALRAFVVTAEEERRDIRRFELEHLDDLAEIDLGSGGVPLDESLVLVCGHGTRDRCCALRGNAVFDALAGRLGAEELWISSHLGGHRFAANVLVLPAGIQLGRVEPDAAGFTVARALGGRVPLEHYRGRTCYPAPVQAAEHAVREADELLDVDDLRLLGVDGRLVRFRSRDGNEWSVEVEEMRGPAVPASCGVEPTPQRTFGVRVM
jgi:hypothetical protein